MKRADRQPLGDVYLYGDVFVKEVLVPEAFTLLPQHSHTYDHLSYVAAGSVNVFQDSSHLGFFRAPCAIRVPAREKHIFQTLSDNTLILCIHNAAHGEAADIHEEHQLEFED